jgi:NADH-ubiquinone oxidoreductase chain 4
MVAMEITLLVMSPTIQVLCALTLIYSCLSTLRQADIKIIIAYSSVGHMSLSLIGLLSNCVSGLSGGFLLALAHGLSSPFLFFLVGGILYDRFGTRVVNYYRGLSLTMPLFSLFFFIATLSNMGTPGSFNFVGEFLCLLGTFSISFFTGFLISLGIILSAAYSIYLYGRVTGGSSSVYLPYHSDINKREFVICFLFLLFIIVIGFYPNFILNDIQLDISNLILDFSYPLNTPSSLKLTVQF